MSVDIVIQLCMLLYKSLIKLAQMGLLGLLEFLSSGPFYSVGNTVLCFAMHRVKEVLVL